MDFDFFQSKRRLSSVRLLLLLLLSLRIQNDRPGHRSDFHKRRLFFSIVFLWILERVPERELYLFAVLFRRRVQERRRRRRGRDVVVVGLLRSGNFERAVSTVRYASAFFFFFFSASDENRRRKRKEAKREEEERKEEESGGRATTRRHFFSMCVCVCVISASNIKRARFLGKREREFSI